ncbi:MAG: hypothetical protein ACE5E4_13350, partial [Candidatus Binatia bacterium]
MNSTRRLMFFVLCAFVPLSLSGVVMPSQVLGAQVRLELPVGAVNPGGTVVADVIIDVGADVLGAYTVIVDCNVVQAQIAPPAAGGATFPFTAPPFGQNITGCHAELTAFQFSSFTSPTGAVSVARLSFLVDPAAVPGSTIPLTITPDVVATPLGQSLAATGLGSTITVGGLCGNGSLDPGEQCDDGNTVAGDCCDASCLLETGVCDDGDACTTVDTCSAGACVGTTPPNCDDGNLCTADTCVPATGCVNTDNTAACDDANVCTTDTCDPATGCASTNNTLACDDGNACTQTDTCQAGVC